MSITFRIQGNPTHSYTVDCACGDTTFLCGLTLNDAAAITEAGWVCPNCGPRTQPIICQDDTNGEVNLSNSNAAELFTRLGIDNEPCGTTNPAVLLTTLVFLGADDNGTDDVTHINDGHATLIDVGRPTGYWTRKAAALGRLCVLAIEADQQIEWS